MNEDRLLMLAMCGESSASLMIGCPILGAVQIVCSEGNLNLLATRPEDRFYSETTLVRALAFDALLRRLHELSDIIPLQFGPPLGLQKLQSWFQQNESAMRERLGRIHGTSQLNCRWQFTTQSPGRDGERLPNSDVFHVAAKRSGSDYLKARFRESTAGRGPLHELERVAAEVQQGCPGIVKVQSATVRCLLPSEPNASSNLLGLDCLVERAEVHRARQYLHTVALELRPPDSISECLPPFSFVN